MLATEIIVRRPVRLTARSLPWLSSAKTRVLPQPSRRCASLTVTAESVEAARELSSPRSARTSLRRAGRDSRGPLGPVESYCELLAARCRPSLGAPTSLTSTHPLGASTSDRGLLAGTVAGMLQRASRRAAPGAYAAATNAWEVRRALGSTPSGKAYLVLFWFFSLTLAVALLLVVLRPPSGASEPRVLEVASAQLAFNYARELLTIRPRGSLSSCC